MTDDEMIAYYSKLARQYGDLTARYRNALCLVMDEKHIYAAMDPSMESEKFLITATQHHNHILKQGFRLSYACQVKESSI